MLTSKTSRSPKIYKECISVAFSWTLAVETDVNGGFLVEFKEMATESAGGHMIIAVDFDGILCKNEFPKIGEPNYQIISLVRQLIDKGHEVVLWTTRNGEELIEAVKWCDDVGLHFCNVNGPAHSNREEYKDVYPIPSRKIYADVYIDDHNLEFISRCNGMEYVILYLEKGLKEWITEEN